MIPRLYKKNTEKLDMELFKNPTSEYRSTPFWSWNCKLNKDSLLRQLHVLKKMGFGGFHIQPGTGMDTAYLSKDFMHLVCACLEEGKKLDMLTWLYDEDRYSSGQAGGYVLSDPRFRIRFLEFTTEKRNLTHDSKNAYINGDNYFLTAFDVLLSDDDYLLDYKQIGFDEKPSWTKYYVYCMTEEDSGWFNNKCHVDTLSDEAMQRFVDITYDAYKQSCGHEYGKSIPAMFTDEPQISHFVRFDRNSTKPAKFAWTYGFEESFMNKYGFDIIASIPEIIIDLPNNSPSKARYCFFDHVSELLATCFLDKCGERCDKDGLFFTGHIMGEHMFETNAGEVGDVMRMYRNMTLPGIDMLVNKLELDTAKQCQSAVRQYGRKAMLSELYGVTNYDFDFRGHKFQADWQSALGVTVRVPHLAWVSMEGNAKRAYPGTINYQAPWCEKYKMIEDHLARVSSVLSRGKAVCNVVVIHPIESYWLEEGPESTSGARREKYQHKNGIESLELTQTLLFNHIDFDYISESLLPSQLGEISDTLQVGCMRYKTVLISNCRTLRKTTADALIQFSKCGGKVIIVGDYPEFVDLEVTDSLKSLIEISVKIRNDSNSIVEALEDVRTVEMKLPDGSEAPNKIYQLRRDGDTSYLFIANTDRRYRENITSYEDVTFKLKGEYAVTLLDTMSGEERRISYEIEDGKTVFKYPFYLNTSALFKLENKTDKNPCLVSDTAEEKPTYSISFDESVDYSYDNYNALLLDKAEYSLDGGEFLPEDELLRLDNKCREAVGILSRLKLYPQPWVVKIKKPEHFINLRFTFESEIELDEIKLAIENPDTTKIAFNGMSIDPTPIGYYVDESIKIIKLGKLAVGKNILELTLPLGERTNTEWCYVLGKFGVKVLGEKGVITAQQDKLAFDSTTKQGLPFYGHNVTYKLPLSLKNDVDVAIRVEKYIAQVLEVFVDGENRGTLAFAPYKMHLGRLSKGEHSIEIKAYGSLINTFGAIHYCGNSTWMGPEKWFSDGDEFTYEYNLRDFGILSSPIIDVFES